MRDYKGIIRQVTNVVAYEYKINVFTSAWFKVFSQHLTYISGLEAFNPGNSKGFFSTPHIPLK